MRRLPLSSFRIVLRAAAAIGLLWIGGVLANAQTMCMSDTDCDDGNKCTVHKCDAGQCTYTPLVCNDNNACTNDSCNPTTGCVYTAVICDDDSKCTVDTCDVTTGKCVFRPIDCNDYNACTSDTCDPAHGCQNAPISCNDANDCTIDTCDPVTGCNHVLNSSKDICLVPPDALQLVDPSNLLAGNSYVNITNAGTRGGYDVTQTGFGPAGGVCANLYVFDPSEEMVACCSCYVSPDGLRSLGSQDLVTNALTSSRPNGVTIKLLASTPTGTNGTTCDPASPTLTTLEPGLRAWGTDLHLNTATGAYNLTEKPFAFATLSESEFQKLTSFCAFIKANGSTFGICKECRLGGSLGGDIR